MQSTEYAWFNEEEFSGLRLVGCSISFIAGIHPVDIQRRLRLGPATDVGSMQTSGGPNSVSVHDAAGGVILIERGGFSGITEEIVRTLSENAVYASVTLTFESDAMFVHAMNGEIETAFSVYDPAVRWGANPHVLMNELENLEFPPARNEEEYDGLDDEEEMELIEEDIERQKIALECAIALASRVTGLRLLREHLTEAHPRYSISHIYEQRTTAGPLKLIIAPPVLPEQEC